jgi:transcriptional regulator with XRE-family HTH domain
MKERVVNGRQLRLLRERAGMHRRDLAEAIGCSTGHLKNVEIEAGGPGVNQLSSVLAWRTVNALSTALGRPVGIEEFTTATGVVPEQREAS